MDARLSTAEQVDPITIELIGSALSSIVEEMGEALVRASYSTNIKERRDCSTAIFNVEGQTLCQAEHVPIHLGSFIGIVPHILKRHPLRNMRPGDVFIGNDAYEGGGTHLPDIVLAEPIFFDNEVVAFAVNTAHHSDFVDRAHANIYQEGIRIPPIHYYKAGELNKDVQDLILLNCQVPAERLSDFRAQMAANRLASRRVVALCSKYGKAAMLTAARELLNYAERKMRAGIAALPDGIYRFEDVYDAMEIETAFDLSVEITVSGSDMYLKFDAPPQVRVGINVVYTALLATVYYAVKAAVDPSILPNSGLGRPLHVTAPEGSLLNCSHPAAVNSRLGTCQRVVDLIHGALAKAAPQQLTAASNGSCYGAYFNGVDPRSGKFWVYVETIGGGAGARHDDDGLDGVHVHMTNTSNLPCEAMEVEYPLTLLRYELVDGSGGEGARRGGMGLRRVYRAEATCQMRVAGSRVRTRPWGLGGGGEGASGHFDFGSVEFNRGIGYLKRGDIVEIVTPGGGGYGRPEDRPNELVEKDIREHRVAASGGSAVGIAAVE